MEAASKVSVGAGAGAGAGAADCERAARGAVRTAAMRMSAGFIFSVGFIFTVFSMVRTVGTICSERAVEEALE
jgi:hypothetical protein